MSTLGVIGLACLFLLMGVPAVVAIAANTAALREEKELRAAVKGLQKEVDAMSPDACAEDVAALLGRIAVVDRRMAEWKRSAFVVRAR